MPRGRKLNVAKVCWWNRHFNFYSRSRPYSLKKRKLLISSIALLNWIIVLSYYLQTNKLVCWLGTNGLPYRTFLPFFIYHFITSYAVYFFQVVPREINTDRRNYSVDDQKFVPDTEYAARVRSSPNQYSYKGQWSDWSSEVHWKTESAGESPQKSAKKAAIISLIHHPQHVYSKRNPLATLFLFVLSTQIWHQTHLFRDWLRCSSLYVWWYHSYFCAMLLLKSKVLLSEYQTPVQPTAFSYNLNVVFVFLYPYRWKQSAFIPTPEPYFHTLYSDCQGDFKVSLACHMR